MAAPTIQTKIRKAIEARVASLPMVKAGQPYDLVWSVGDSIVTVAGASYIPSPTKPYLRVTWNPNRASREGRVSSSLPVRRMGVLQIDVFDTKARGPGVATETAGKIAEHFPLDYCMSFMGVGVRVMEPPSVLAPFIDTHIQVPVTIETDCFA